MKKLFLVDDHAVVLFGLTSALERFDYKVIGTASTVNQARSQISAFKPDAVIVDINLSDSSGFDLVIWIRKIDRDLPIIVLTLNDSLEFAHAAKKSGANAFVVKNAPIEELIGAVDFAFSNPGSFTSKRELSSQYEFGLTAREIDVLKLIDMGLTNEGISEKLFLSQSTVKSHASAILRKLSAGNRVEAVRIARNNGLLV
jgi:DNA-binding NarL/FixJ family response regulator